MYAIRPMKETYHKLEETNDPQIKMELLLRLSQGFLNSDLQRCEEVAMQLLQLGEEHNMQLAVVYHYLILGRVSYRKGGMEQAFGLFSKASTLAEKQNNKAGMAACKEMDGVMANQQGRHTDALELFMQCQRLYLEVNAPATIMGLVFNNIGNTYNYLAKYEEAEKYYRQAIETLENTERRYSNNLIKSNLGLLLYYKKRYTEAIVLFEECLVGYIERNNTQAQIQTYSHIGQSYLCQAEHAKALLSFQKALKLIRSSNLTTELSSVYHGLGQLYTAIGGHKEALKYLNKALAIRLEKSFWALACETYEGLYKLHTLTADSATATQVVVQGLKLSSEKGLEEWQVKFSQLK